MLKENWRSIGRIERCFDAAIIITAFLLAYRLRVILPSIAEYLHLRSPFTGKPLAPLNDYLMLLLVSLASHLGALEVQGAYGSMRLRSLRWLFWVFVVSSFVAFVSLATAAFMLKIDASRAFIGLHCSITFLGLQAGRFVVLRFLRYWRRKGRNFRNLVVCGRGVQAADLIRTIGRRPELGIRIMGVACLDNPTDKVRADLAAFREGLRVRCFVSDESASLVGVDELTVFLTDAAVDEVVFADVVSVMSEVEEMVMRCSQQGVRSTLVADLFSIGMVRSGLSYFGTIPLIHYQTPPGDRWDLSVKRLVDVLVSGSILVLFAPLFAAIAVAVRCSSPGPILYKQKRMGLNGRLFSLYKFRSMYADADERLVELLNANEMRGPAFKLRNDPRVTFVGRLLRRHSLDELPQLWNVFRGDMSLVGPRPPMPHEVRLYDRRERRRLSMRPGLTCTWQVSGRSDISDFESWVQLDLEYIDNWSLARDLWLLARTVPAVVVGTGAR